MLLILVLVDKVPAGLLGKHLAVVVRHALDRGLSIPIVFRVQLQGLISDGIDARSNHNAPNLVRQGGLHRFQRALYSGINEITLMEYNRQKSRGSNSAQANAARKTRKENISAYLRVLRSQKERRSIMDDILASFERVLEAIVIIQRGIDELEA